MDFLTKTYLVEGSNHDLLFKRLKRANVNLVKVQIINKKQLKITIDVKDTPKFFAICKNSWYNKELKIGGIFAPFYKCVSKWIVTLAIICFFVFSYAFNNLYLQTEYQGDSIYFTKQIQTALNNAGVHTYRFFSQKQLNAVEIELKKEKEIAFVSAQKCGNRSIIYIKRAQIEPERLPVYQTDLIANEDMVILKITVYSGTAVVQENCAVKKGDIIAKASYFLKDEEEIKCPLICLVTAECVYEYVYESEFKINDGAKNNALALAKFTLGDYHVRSYSFEVIGKNKLKVILKYEKTLVGG